MIPIYFPYTYISESVAKAVHTNFKPFTVYQPSQGLVLPVMREWQQNGLIEICMPPKGDEERLSHLLKDFHNWAASHGDAPHSGFDYIRAHQGMVPFFDETSVTQIRADIKRGTPYHDQASETRYFSARYFLSIAQEMDMEADSLAADMQRHHDLEKKLFSDLSGDADIASSQISPLDPGASVQMDYMIEERLMAWWLLVSGVTKQTQDHLPAIFVTTNRRALDHLFDSTTEAEEIIALEGIPIDDRNKGSHISWRHELMNRLLMLTQVESSLEMIDGMDWPIAPEIDNHITQLKLSIFLIPGKSPNAFFNSTLCQVDLLADWKEHSSRSRSTVLALIET